MAEELVGHEVRREGEELIGSAPDGAEVRLLRLSPGGPPVFEALTAAAGEHVEAVLDAGSAVNGDVVLVLPRLAARLDRVLDAGVSAGEAVTVLVPLVTTLERLHAAGVAHGALGLTAVGFDERGAAVLTRFEHAMLRTTDPVGFDRARRQDEEALQLLAAAVLRAADARPLAAAVEAGRVPIAGLPDALFALADPSPVRLPPPFLPPASRPASPGRLELPVGEPLPRAEPGDLEATALSGPAALVRRAAGATARSLRGVRPRAWIAVAGSLGLLAAALVLLPGHGASGTPAPFRSRPVATRSVMPPPSPSRSPLAVPTDAATAVRMLLDERARCVATASVACLARVESAGSPVLAQDGAAVAAGVEAVAVPTAPVRLRAASGSTALLSIGDATVLLLREQHGWRLRDVTGPPARKPTARPRPRSGG